MPLDLPLPPEATVSRSSTSTSVTPSSTRARAVDSPAPPPPIPTTSAPRRDLTRSGGPARYPAGTGQWDPGHSGGLDSERGEVLGLEVVHVGFAARPGQSGDLHGHGAQ